MLEEKAEANRIKQQHIRLDQFKKRQQEIADAQKSQDNILQNIEHEKQLRELEKLYEDSEDSEYSDDDDLEELDEESEIANLENDFDDIGLDDLYCVPCEKQFNNRNALKNHNSRPMHKVNLEKLISEMHKEEKQRNKSNEDVSEEILDELDLSGEEEDQLLFSEKDSLDQPSKKSKKKRQKESNRVEVDEIVDLLENKFDDDNDWNDKKKNKKTSKKSKTTKVSLQKHEPEQNDDLSAEEETSDLKHVCVTCNASFQSKNKLFTHLKTKNHGVHIPNKQAASQRSSTNGKKKK